MVKIAVPAATAPSAAPATVPSAAPAIAPSISIADAELPAGDPGVQDAAPLPSVDVGNSWFEGHDKIALYEQWWRPENPKAAVVIIHGYAEHSSRYAHVAETLVTHGYAAYAYDHRAHGQSDGKNTFVNSIDDFVDDLALYMDHIQPQIKGLPLFILGHSMGGLITSLYMAKHQPPVQGVVLTSPLLAVDDKIPGWLVKFSTTLGKLLPKLPTVQIEYKFISRDEEILAVHRADPLIYRGRVPARTGAELGRGIQMMGYSMEKITAPLLILHGGADQIAMVRGSQQLYGRAAHSDKTLKIYDGLYHEILNEIEREDVKADIVAWMDERYSDRE